MTTAEPASHASREIGTFGIVNYADHPAHTAKLDLSSNSSDASSITIINPSHDHSDVSSVTYIDLNAETLITTNIHIVQRSSGLSEAALATHTLNYDLDADLHEATRKVEGLERAARNLGFDLPFPCFEGEKWQLPEWNEVQRTLS